MWLMTADNVSLQQQQQQQQWEWRQWSQISLCVLAVAQNRLTLVYFLFLCYKANIRVHCIDLTVTTPAIVRRHGTIHNHHSVNYTSLILCYRDLARIWPVVLAAAAGPTSIRPFLTNLAWVGFSEWENEIWCIPSVNVNHSHDSDDDADNVDDAAADDDDFIINVCSERCASKWL